MEALKTNRRILTWLCAYPADKNVSKSKKFAFGVFTLSVSVANISGLIAGLAFIIYTDDLETRLNGVIPIVALINMTYTAIVSYFVRHEITATIEILLEIYKISKAHFIFNARFQCFNYYFNARSERHCFTSKISNNNN